MLLSNGELQSCDLRWKKGGGSPPHLFDIYVMPTIEPCIVIACNYDTLKNKPSEPDLATTSRCLYFFKILSFPDDRLRLITNTFTLWKLKKSSRFWGQARYVQELLLLVILGRVHFHSPWAQFIKPFVLWKHLALWHQILIENGIEPSPWENDLKDENCRNFGCFLLKFYLYPRMRTSFGFPRPRQNSDILWFYCLYVLISII